MKRWAWFTALGLGLVGCEGDEIAIFSANQGGSAGMSGMSDASAGLAGAGSAGAIAAATAGAAPGRPTGASGGDGDAGNSPVGDAGAIDPPCLSTAECGDGYYCSKRTCGDVQGVCSLRPFPDDSADLPVCGCDHIIYWNDSIRQWYGVSASTVGPCNSQPDTCGHDEDCPKGALCAHLQPPTGTCSSSPGPGRCWVIPRDCSATDSALQYQVCPPPNAPIGGSQPCVTRCQAIQSRHPFTQLSQDQTCP